MIEIFALKFAKFNFESEQPLFFPFFTAKKTSNLTKYPTNPSTLEIYRRRCGVGRGGARKDETSRSTLTSLIFFSSVTMCRSNFSNGAYQLLYTIVKEFVDGPLAPARAPERTSFELKSNIWRVFVLGPVTREIKAF